MRWGNGKFTLDESYTGLIVNGHALAFHDPKGQNIVGRCMSARSIRKINTYTRYLLLTRVVRPSSASLGQAGTYSSPNRQLAWPRDL